VRLQKQSGYYLSSSITVFITGMLIYAETLYSSFFEFEALESLCNLSIAVATGFVSVIWYEGGGNGQEE